MLTEIALTPQTFMPFISDKSGWRAQLSALSRRLRDFGKQCPIVFSNLNVGDPAADWATVVPQLIARMESTSRGPAMHLFDLIAREHQHLVSRPSYSRIRKPDDETHWVHEAMGPSPEHPITHIVTSHEGANACRKLFADAIGMHDLDGAGFWQDVSPTVPVHANLSAQMAALRPILLHGQFIAVVLPHGIGSEEGWFFALARQALARPTSHGVPRIELHVSLDGNPEELKKHGAEHPKIKSYIGRARQALPRGASVSLYARVQKPRDPIKQQFIARRLFAGSLRDVGTDTPAERVRWGVVLEHVAPPGDATEQTAHTFSLLSRQEAHQQFQFECRNTAPRILGPVSISC